MHALTTVTLQSPAQPSLTPEDTLRAELAEIELTVLTSYTLGDAIREGCTVTRQAYNWGSGGTACALSAGAIAARARGYLT